MNQDLTTPSSKHGSAWTIADDMASILRSHRDIKGAEIAESIRDSIAALPSSTEKSREIDPLPRACNLAGVDYQTYLRIKAYMPVTPTASLQPRPISEFPELQEAVSKGLTDGSLNIQGAAQPALPLMTVSQFNNELKNVLSTDGVTQAHVGRIDLVGQNGTRITIVDGTFESPTQKPVQQKWPVSQDHLTQLQVAALIAERDVTQPAAQPAPVQKGS